MLIRTRTRSADSTHTFLLQTNEEEFLTECCKVQRLVEDEHHVTSMGNDGGMAQVNCVKSQSARDT